jgi:hypothetical protein
MPITARLSRLALVTLLAFSPSTSQAATLAGHEPAGGPAVAAEERCSAALQPFSNDTRPLTLSITNLAPFARDILSRYGIRTTVQGSGRQLRVQLHLGPVQDLRLPEGSAATLYLPGRSASDVMRDPRSRMPSLWQLDEATVIAADMAYDLRLPAAEDEVGSASLESDPGQLPGYRPVKLYADAFSGFAAIAFEAQPESGRPRHRIYAIAGTHVFEHRDFRTWASGLTFGRAQFTSAAALQLIRDAAAYAQDTEDGGEVVLTGQSQGGLVAQGVGYMLQTYLDSSSRGHHLAHIVSWGAVGAQEVILRMIEQARRDGGRGIGRDLERHWAASQPGYAEAAGVWSVLAQHWRAMPRGSEVTSIQSTARRMRALGYFFEIDLFARAGTFLGTTMAFPTELILPGGCDMTVLETLFGVQGGTFGVRLESHFLKGYRRAVSRGAIALARPALPGKWPWATEILSLTDAPGMVWLETLYLDGPASSPANWKRCLAAQHWLTRDNSSCRESFWAGCSPAPDGAGWCLIAKSDPSSFSVGPR